MNIFVTDFNPSRAARSLCDKHVNKMTIESTQILCSALHLNGVDMNLLPKTKSGTAPRPTHIHHPCVQWAATSRANFLWLSKHGFLIAANFRVRYGHEHFCWNSIKTIRSEFANEIPDIPMTPFPLCMPDEFKGLSVVESYRRYYFSKRLKMKMEWRTRKPDWWIEMEQQTSS